jgi:phosphoglycolate phosphatase-like HAD superfamily hydrolase
MIGIKIALFDVDGVLLDSLDAHLQVCRDEAVRLGLKIRVPDAARFRNIVAQGAIISPMTEFFHTVGFPRPLAEIANEHYKREFAQKYPVRPFAGVPRMLAKIAATAVCLGIVTSNTRTIISASLGDAMRWFDPRCIFADDDPRRLSKPQALDECARRFAIKPEEVLYIGDQPRDFAAAQAVGAQFLGVAYGWGITGDDAGFVLARSPEEVTEYVRSHVSASVADCSPSSHRGSE